MNTIKYIQNTQFIYFFSRTEYINFNLTYKQHFSLNFYKCERKKYCLIVLFYQNKKNGKKEKIIKTLGANLTKHTATKINGNKMNVREKKIKQ